MSSMNGITQSLLDCRYSGVNARIAALFCEPFNHSPKQVDHAVPDPVWSFSADHLPRRRLSVRQHGPHLAQQLLAVIPVA